MLGQRRRRWLIIGPTSTQRFLFVGMAQEHGWTNIDWVSDYILLTGMDGPVHGASEEYVILCEKSVHMRNNHSYWK